MAKYVVPPVGCKDIIVKCYRCKTLYVPEIGRHPYGDEEYYEKCPICGAAANSWENVIPLWKYNLIKWFRGGKILEQTDNRGADDKGFRFSGGRRERDRAGDPAWEMPMSVPRREGLQLCAVPGKPWIFLSRL